MEQVSKAENDLKKIFKFFKDYSDKYFNTECCGFLGIKDGCFIAQIVPNRSPEPNLYFSIDPIDVVKFSNENQIIAIFHSHTNVDAEFSDFDKESCNCICIPYLMYSVQENKFSLYIPETHEIDVNILDKVKGAL